MKKFKFCCFGLLRLMNLSGHIANHLVGEHHTMTHQRITGVIIMIIGVCIAKSTPLLPHSFIIHLTTDVVGYGFHGIGLIPFATKLEKSTKN